MCIFCKPISLMYYIIYFVKGKNCEKCVNIDCKNGGICVSSDSGHGKCRCAAGYRGLSCTESDCDNYCIEVC